MKNNTLKSKPLILGLATEIKNVQSLEIKYNHLKSMSFIEINNVPIPVIETNNSRLELLTKTKVHQERDDEEINLLELQTKTEVRQERDDEGINLLELQTKTLVSRERDDENFNYN